MATYKLIQDIEAEDHILGPLTLRQFIFALIAVFMFYLCFIVATKGVAFLLVLFLPPALFFGFFALPFGRDQPTEVWALAKLQFWFKPRRRTWNQSGVKELVTITVPKKVERVLTNGLSQTEVNSRLQALAQTLDSRGWVTKNVNVNTYTQPVAMVDNSDDRLINISSLPQEVPNDVVVASDDIMDEVNNPIAQQFESMINKSSQTRRQQLMDKLNDVREDSKNQVSSQTGAAASYWFMPQGQTAAAAAMPAPPAPMPAVAAATTPAPAATDTDAEAAISASLAARASAQQISFGNLRTVQPLTAQQARNQAQVAAAVTAQPAVEPPASDTTTTPAIASDQATPVTAPSDPDILSLATNNDLNVATLAREAHKNKGDGQSRDEVVISLH